MALPDKHQLKFNSYKDAKTLIEAIKKRLTHTLIWRNKADLEEQSLGDLFNSLKIYETEVKQSSSTGTPSQNLAFVSSSHTNSTTDSVSTAANVFAACAKLPASPLPNVDSLSNAIDVDDLEEMDLRWQMAMLTMRARRSLQRLCLIVTIIILQKVIVKVSHLLSPTKSVQDLSHTTRPSVPSIEDRVSDSEEEFETKAIQFVPSFAQSSKHVKSPRHSNQPIKTTILVATPIPASPKSNSSGKRRNRKACFICKSVDHVIKDYDYHTKKIAQPTPRNYAYRGHHKQYAPLTHSKLQKHMAPVVSAAQGKQGTWGNPQLALKDKGVIDSGNPKGGKITGKGKIKTVLLRVPRENNMYNINLKNIVPSGDLTCLFAKATIDESNLWHRRLGHINFKTINKLVKGNLVRGLPTKVFKNDNTCVACKKGKQHRASCKTKPVSTVDQPLFRLHMDLFGSTFVKSLNKKSYCLVITDDYSRFTWVFFLATKDETSPILKTFITGLKNQLSLRVKVIRSDNETEFKNSNLNQFCGLKGIKREFSIPRTPQQNGIAERKNRTLIEAARTMLAVSLLPIPFWAEAVNTACYEIKLTLVQVFQDKLDAKKAGEEVDQTYVLFPVYSAGSTNPQNNDEDAALDGKEHDFDAKKPESVVILFSISSAQTKKQDDKTKIHDKGKSHVESFTGYRDLNAEFEDCSENSKNEVNAAGSIVPTVGQNYLNNTNTFSATGPSISAAGPSNTTVSPTYGKSYFIDASQIPNDPDMPELEDITYSDDEDVVGTEVDFNNLESSIPVSPIQQQEFTKIILYHKLLEEPKRVHQALKDPIARIEAIRLFLAYASFMGFMVYLMDVKSAFLYGTIEEEVYVCQPSGFEDPNHPDKVYKVVKALY
nr:putative ribonuclease H-like domain-containing protein [Tanacetum cinerariifolium]